MLNRKHRRSVWLGYIPTLQVDPLAALMVDPSSDFYHTKADITKQLVSGLIDREFAID